ncbi:hypothetical protein N8T08_007823 [Aspergillus melleus]|uniref:Uncharacterized protein n=1 Tax=Aspergillus melleus TaxID=138277 RepID=A0ACC3AX00_9EURO|nr:hypothetical protein N8T08_007823 [Aspergillus melleus]
MKLLSSLLVLLVSILACSAAVVDIATDLDTRSESSQLAKCRTSRDCVNFFKVCKNGTCQYRGHQTRDEPEPESPSESGPEPVENELKVDKLDVKLVCQKDADCGNGVCLENVCVDAEANDDEDPDDDEDMHIQTKELCSSDKDCPKDTTCILRNCRRVIRFLTPGTAVSKARKTCKSDNDCTKDKRCTWGACRTPVKLTHSTRDDESINDDPDTEFNDDATDLDVETDSEFLAKREVADLESGAHDIDDIDDADKIDDPEARLFTRAKRCKTFKDCDAGYACKNKRCERRDCATRPTCASGRCLNGKCVRSLDLETETDDDDESDTGIFERSKYPPYCKSKNDCPPNNRCYGGICKYRPPHLSKRDTIAGLGIEIVASKPPPRCQSNNDCPKSQRCYGGICKYRPPHNPPKRDEDTTILERDVLALTSKYPPRCKSKDDCPPRYRCYGGICKYRGLNALKRDDEDISERQVGGTCQSRGIPGKREKSEHPQSDEDYDIGDDEREVEE